MTPNEKQKLFQRRKRQHGIATHSTKYGPENAFCF